MLYLMKLILEILKDLALSVVLETTSHETSQLQSEVVRQRPEWQIRRPIRYGVDEYADTVSCDKEQQPDHVANVCQIVEPATMEEALSGNHASDWRLRI